jgi:hypothetical protein
MKGIVMVHQLKGFKTIGLMVGLWGNEECAFRKDIGADLGGKTTYALGA